jgi:peroxiredoxin
MKLRSKIIAAVVAVSAMGALSLLGPVYSTTWSGVSEASAKPATRLHIQTNAAPDFTLKDINGKSVSLSDFKGKVVVLNFWATWCTPCIHEIPDFNALQAKYGSSGVQFIGVAVDDEGISKVKPWVQKNNVGYPILLSDDDIFKKYGDMSAIPTTFIIDRSGNIRERYVGARQRQVLEDKLVPLVAEK